MHRQHPQYDVGGTALSSWCVVSRTLRALDNERGRIYATASPLGLTSCGTMHWLSVRRLVPRGGSFPHLTCGAGYSGFMFQGGRGDSNPHSEPTWYYRLVFVHLRGPHTCAARSGRTALSGRIGPGWAPSPEPYSLTPVYRRHGHMSTVYSNFPRKSPILSSILRGVKCH